MDTKNFLQEVADRFGTPSFLYDIDVIRDQYLALRKLLAPCCDIFYSMKANPLLAICEYFHHLGAQCEVSSKNELFTALTAGFTSEQIIFVGPGKNQSELELAVEKNIKAIICESIDEFMLVNKIAHAQNKMIKVMARINPDFTVNHAPMKMTGVASQFGISTDIFIKNKNLIKKCTNIKLEGIQIYNATRILNPRSIIDNIEKILLLAQSLSEEYGCAWKYVDFGGGFGIPYFENEKQLSIPELICHLNCVLLQYKNHFPSTQFILELGRYLVAESGYLISRVQAIKTNHQKNYIVIDAGMDCLYFASSMGSFVHRNFQADSISITPRSDTQEIYHVAGPLCTPGDILLKNISLHKVSVEDLIIIKNAGAYGPTASVGRFLSRGMPAEVIRHDHFLYLCKRREEIGDILTTQYSHKKIFNNY